jgi:hypothetical protein
MLNSIDFGFGDEDDRVSESSRMRQEAAEHIQRADVKSTGASTPSTPVQAFVEAC